MPLGRGAIDAMAMGQLGSDIIRDTGVYTAATSLPSVCPGWGIIEALSDTTFTTLTSGKLPNNTDDCVKYRPNLAGFTLFKGQRLYGFWTAITLATGSVVAYRI